MTVRRHARSRTLFLTLTGLLTASFTAGPLAEATSKGIHDAMNSHIDYIADALPERLWYVQEWGNLGINTSVKPEGRDALRLRVGDTEYGQGLGSHANGSICVDLAGEYDLFEAEIGVHPEVVGKGSVVFRVLVDGREAFCSGVVRAGEPPKRVSVSVSQGAELLLIADDADDGIAYDVADWCNARLTRSAAVPDAVVLPSHDVAPLARILTIDPDGGTIREADKAADRGGYILPVHGDATASLILAWDHMRSFYRLTLEFHSAAELPDVNAIKLRVRSWGDWQDTVAKWYTNRNTLTCLLDERSAINSGIRQVHCILPVDKQPMVIKAAHAYDQSTYGSKTVALRIEGTGRDQESIVPITIRHGSFLSTAADDTPWQRVWNTGSPLEIDVHYTENPSPRVQRTALQFRMPGLAFAVAVDDVLENGCVYIPHAGVFVTTQPPVLSLADHQAAVARGETVLEQVRGMPDQTLAQAMANVHNPVQDKGPIMLSLACHNRKFTVEDSGSILGTLAVRFGDERNPSEYSRRLEGDWRPIPVQTFRQDAITYRQRTCVAPVDDSPPVDSPDWQREQAVCVIEYVVENTGRDTATAFLALSFASTPERPVKMEAIDEGVVAFTDNQLVAFIEMVDATGLEMALDANTITITGDLAASKSVRLHAYLPAWDITKDDYAALSAGNRWFEQTAAYWDKVLAPAMQVDVPDAFLNNVIRASQVYCMMAARSEDHGRLVAAWISSDRYGALDTESQAVIRGMDMIGQEAFARRSLNYWLAQYNPEGFFLNYSIAGVGENLWTLAEHYERTRDQDWLWEAAPTIVRACKWIMAERRHSMTGGEGEHKAPEWGLMPPGTTADWSLKAHRFFNDAQFFAGLAEAGRVLATIDHPEAAAMMADAARYREDIIRAYRWNQARSPVLRLNNGSWVPYYSSILYCLGPAGEAFPGQDWGRSWCYDVEIGAHHLVVNGILDPLGQDATDIINHMEDVQFLLSGMGDYPAEKNRADVFNLGGFAKVQPYYARIAEVYAMRDDVRPFIRTYFNSLASLISTENLSLWEHFNNMGAWNKTHETGWFLCQTRIMFVQERGDELWLAPFVTGNWLKHGMIVTVRNAPTRFGPVSYTIRSGVDDGHIDATIAVPRAKGLKQVVIRLRHPRGARIQSVNLGAKMHEDFDPDEDTVRLTPSSGPMEIRAVYIPQ